MSVVDSFDININLDEMQRQEDFVLEIVKVFDSAWSGNFIIRGQKRKIKEDMLRYIEGILRENEFLKKI